MKFLKHIRSKSLLKNKAEPSSTDQLTSTVVGRNGYGQSLAAILPPAVLQNILAFVCPHAQDENLESCEDSMTEDGCMLCDMRDLAHCASVNHKWNTAAQDLLYHSVRMDAVHYCEKEIELSEKRQKRRSFRSNQDVADAPQQRLKLFSRTVRENISLAVVVHFLKLPYMTRETCKADLARTVSVLPNLEYVDLPEGFFSDDPSCHTLKQELQARCPEIQKMKYNAGSEPSFSLLGQNRAWQALQTLELSQLALNPGNLLMVLASLPILHELKMSDFPAIDDTIFQSTPMLPSLPALQKLSLQSTPNLTVEGLSLYLSRPETREVLSSLVLNSTGILPTKLHLILASATRLSHLSIVDEITRPFPLEPVPSLASTSLHTLHYELTSSSAAQGFQRSSDSYYSHLAQSLLSDSLPHLRELYVRDSNFPDTVLLAPPTPAFARSSSNAGFRQKLNIYSKGLDELEWNFTSVSPPAEPGARGSMSATRPVSAYQISKGLSPQWGGNARQSVVVGNGFGGFLAVPTEDSGWPSSPTTAERRGSRADLWR
ncbi:MAG: hypothetical protein M1819_006890 [Sarea resinae]|nr:MAG: hypothetical protein M1819_006890 [Sarea resinae]